MGNAEYMGRTPRPSLKMIVKVFASCLLAVAAASSESSSSESGSREGFRGPGLYFSPIEVDLACTAGSPLGAKMGEGMEGDWCVLSQLGWIDEMGNENNETSTADLMSLKPEVLAE